MKYYTQVVVRWYVEPDVTKSAICLATIALKMNFGIVTPGTTKYLILQLLLNSTYTVVDLIYGLQVAFHCSQ